jgi:NAD(P)-dependent dehydrogenase (short-subunit alcohol dehydrogenase family)
MKTLNDSNKTGDFMKLAEKVALVTGGNSGIGLATAKLFSQEGAKVVITGRDRGTLQDAAAEIGTNVLALPADVTHLAEIDQLYQTINANFGKIDVIFANAGIGRFTTMADTTEAIYDEVFAVNLKGLYFTVQKAVNHLNDGAAIVLNTSFLAELGRPGTSLVSASKAAVRSLTKTFAAELIDRRIRVNAVSPGAIATPFHNRTGLPTEVVATNAQRFITQIPMQRFGTAEEIAQAVLFLSTTDSAYVLGTEIAVDGGISQL